MFKIFNKGKIAVIKIHGTIGSTVKYKQIYPLIIKAEKKLFSLIKILSENRKTTPEKPTNIPIDLIKLIFSLLIKKCAKIAAVKGVLAINIAARLL